MPKASCVNTGCYAPRYARGLCKKCYNAEYYKAHAIRLKTKNKAWEIANHKKRRALARENMKRRYARLRAADLCTACCAPAYGYSRCEPCRLIQSDRMARYRGVEREYSRVPRKQPPVSWTEEEMRKTQKEPWWA